MSLALETLFANQAMKEVNLFEDINAVVVDVWFWWDGLYRGHHNGRILRAGRTTSGKEVRFGMMQDKVAYDVIWEQAQASNQACKCGRGKRQS